jgi:hypothetical protein
MESVGQVFEDRFYWRRLWIVQELLSATEVTVVCGQRSVDFRLLALAYAVLFLGLDTQSGSSILLPPLDKTAVDMFRRVIAKLISTNFQKTKGKGSLAQAIATYSAHIFLSLETISTLCSISPLKLT